MLSSIFPSMLTPYVDEITGDRNVDFNVVHQLLIRYSVFFSQWRKNV